MTEKDGQVKCACGRPAIRTKLTIRDWSKPESPDNVETVGYCYDDHDMGGLTGEAYGDAYGRLAQDPAYIAHVETIEQRERDRSNEIWAESGPKPVTSPKQIGWHHGPDCHCPDCDPE